jgi:Fe-S cluster assembly protein SufD
MNAVAADPSFLSRLAPALAQLPDRAGRERALATLVDLGLPTPRDDAFKYTDLRLLQGRDLAPAPPRPVSIASLAGAVGHAGGAAGTRLVLVDGRPAPALSDPLPAGIVVEHGAAPLGMPGPAAEERLRLLAFACTPERVRISVARGAAVAAPLRVQYVSTGGGSYPWLEIELGSDTALTLLDEHVTLGDSPATTVAVLDLKVGANTVLRHHRLQRASSSAVVLEEQRAELAPYALYQHYGYGFGGGLSRTDLRVRLAGPGAATELRGLFLANGQRQSHTRVVVDHLVAHTQSDQLYRGVAVDRGRGSYDGKVIVHAGAAKSVSRQSSRNLLLAPQARIDVRPQLEIYADDVQCSHGATTGQLDPQMLFYLLSRGLDPSAARGLLTYAFAGDVLREVELPWLKRLLEEQVLGALPDAALIREFV